MTATADRAREAIAAVGPDSPAAVVRAGAVRDVEVVVIGAGQAGLSAAHFLSRRGFGGDEFVVLDADAAPGGAWQHRWPTLTMRDVHGIHELPGMDVPPADPDARASDVVPAYFADYERTFDLPVRRPVAVRSVEEAGDGRLVVRADEGVWRTRVVVNATGTWTRPFWPSYPGMGSFRGRQLHTHDYDGPDGFAGQHVVVVGGGHSAIQHLAEISRVTSTTWVTRRPPRWREGPFDEEAGRAAVAKVADAVEEGRRPASVVSVTGLAVTPPVEEARRRGALARQPMFDRVVPDGVVWDEGSEGGPRFVRADVILWATGFRHALDHLAPLRLRGPEGGIRVDGTHVAGDPRIHLLGYGPSASTIGANRAGREARSAGTSTAAELAVGAVAVSGSGWCTRVVGVGSGWVRSPSLGAAGAPRWSGPVRRGCGRRRWERLVHPGGRGRFGVGAGAVAGSGWCTQVVGAGSPWVRAPSLGAAGAPR